MNDEDLVRRVRRKLDAWDLAPPADVRGRLRAARREALSIDSNERRVAPATLVFASVAVVAITVTFLLRQSTHGIESLPSEDMVMLSTEDDFELYDEVDFLLWLGEQNDADLG